jgi:hypothetical protein
MINIDHVHAADIKDRKAQRTLAPSRECVDVWPLLKEA